MTEGVSAFLMLIVVVMSIAWILLPFLVMGVNKRLDKIIRLLSDQPVEADRGGAYKRNEPGEAPKTVTEPDKEAGNEMGKRDAKILLPIIVAVVVLALVVSIVL